MPQTPFCPVLMSVNRTGACTQRFRGSPASHVFTVEVRQSERAGTGDGYFACVGSSLAEVMAVFAAWIAFVT